VGGGIAALALGCLIAVAVAQQVAATPSSHGVQSALTVGFLGHEGAVLSQLTSTNSVRAKPKVAVTPTAACTSAHQALDATRAKDKAEDTTERAAATSDPNFATADAAEDKAEMAALKPLFDAVRRACGFTRPVPSAQCTAALSAAKAAFAKDRNEDSAEEAAGTEGSTADVSEDQAEKAQLGTLWTSIRTACGFPTFAARLDWRFTSAFGWRH
jgi:hypothetical protein